MNKTIVALAIQPLSVFAEDKPAAAAVTPAPTSNPDPYLLNVGPTAEGLIPEPSVERLEDMGKWMDVNSESIYGTQASPFPKLTWGRCTQKKHDNGTTLYLHVFAWPEDGKLLVPGLENKVESAVLLANNEALKFEKTPDGVELKVPKKALDPNATVIKLEIAGEPKVTAI